MRKSRTTKVTLRFRMLGTGKETLYLDYYPGVENPKTGELMRREYLGLYVVPLKKRTGEPQTNKDGSYKYSEADEETIRYAELIRNNRQNELSKAEIYTDSEAELLKAKERSKGDFIAYFRDLAKDKKDSNYNNWMCALKHLQDYTMKSDNAKVKRFCDIDLLWCERFRDYLLTTKTKRSDKVTLANNTAASYFVKLWVIFYTDPAGAKNYLLDLLPWDGYPFTRDTFRFVDAGEPLSENSLNELRRFVSTLE